MSKIFCFFRILKIENVNLQFTSRNAESRTYIYRLGHLKNSKTYWDELDRMRKVEKSLATNQKHQATYFAHIFPLNDFITPFDTNLISRIK